jgi:hypothetical protein
MTRSRYGIGSADDVDHQNQTKMLLESLDAAAAAGVYVLINLGVDALAQARIGWTGKPGSQ